MAQSKVNSPEGEAQRVTESALLKTVSSRHGQEMKGQQWAAEELLEGLFHDKETRAGKSKSTLPVLYPRERSLGILHVLLFTQVISSLSF